MARDRVILVRAMKEAAVWNLILSILILILAPVVRRARAVSPMAHCSSHLHEIGAAFQLYRADWDDSFPLNRFCEADKPCDPGNVGTDGSPYNWKRALLASGSIKDVGVFRCPSNTRAWNKSDANECDGDESNCAGSNARVKNLPLPISYAYNGGFFHESFGRRTGSEIERPSSLLLVVESTSGFPDLGDWMYRSLFLHSGHRANWLFADGKVRALKVRQTISPNYLWRGPNSSVRHLTVESLNRRLR